MSFTDCHRLICILGSVIGLSACLDFGRPVQLRTDAEPVDFATMDSSPRPDGHLDPTPDLGVDAAPDAELDAEPDAELDAEPDAELDAEPDAESPRDGFIPPPYVESTPHEVEVTCEESAMAPPCNGCPAGTVIPVGWICVPAGRYVIGTAPGEPRNLDDSERRGLWFQPLPFLIQSAEFSQADWRRALPQASQPAWGSETENCQNDDCPMERINLYEAIGAAEAWTRLDLGTGRGDHLCYPQFETDGRIGTGCNEGEESCELHNEADDWQVRYNPACGCDTYRLPTDIEWEIAARAGTRGDRWNTFYEQPFDEVAWHSGNSDGQTHPARQTRPNAFGLYDIIGNVSEWVMDTIPRDEQWNFDRSNTAIRGGNFETSLSHRDAPEPSRLRSSSRTIRANSVRDARIGVRLMRTIYPPGTNNCLCKTTCPQAFDCVDGHCVSAVGTPCEEHYQCGNDGRCVDGICQVEE